MTKQSHLRALIFMAIFAFAGVFAPNHSARAQDETSPAPACDQKAVPANAIETNKQLMDRFVEFINSADEKMADELVSNHAIFYVPGQPEPLKGPEGYLATIQMMRSGFPDIQWKLEETVVEPSKVAARFMMHGTHEGTFFGVPATGKQISVQALNIYHFCNGLIVQEYGQPDMLGLLRQIDPVPH
ncbi:ester cyclase [Rhizobium laguerreae]|uniref:ester cyclase n=1 Tax=Rhizobium laguerreae TaxID=1076926 RepID=UPI00300A0775